LRHRQKVRESIRDNIADIIAEESIIGKDKTRIVKVPIRGVKEYRFIYGENAPGVGQGGEGEVQPGQTVGKGKEQGKGHQAGDQAGMDYYETEVSLDELVEVMFEDLELPDLDRKHLRQMEVDRQFRQKGFRKKGIRVRLDKKRTARSRVKRKKATHRPGAGTAGAPRFPFHKEDLRYHHTVTEIRRESNAVVLCIMDTSGSMDTMKKYLARSFFFLLYRFLCTRYQNVEIVFIAHHTEAREVTEDEFFHKGESGGTFISSGYVKALEIIYERYHPGLWNVYAFHCSDGDNFESDNTAALKAAKELAQVSNLFGYGEIKPLGAGYYGGSMIQFFSQIQEANFQTVQIQRKEDIWPSFKTFLNKDRARDDAA
jgi:sporulation protein YhbH